MNDEFEEDESGAGQQLDCQQHAPVQPPVDWMRTERAVHLAWVRGDERFDADRVMGELAQSVSSFADPGGDSALATLAEHVPILESLWLRLTAEALAEKNTERAGRKLRSALLAHAEFSRTLVLVQGLARQKRQQALVTVGLLGDVGGGADERE